MASSKKKTSVDDYLSQETKQGMIRRGAGMRLSTETVPVEEVSHNRTIAPRLLRRRVKTDRCAARRSALAAQTLACSVEVCVSECGVECMHVSVCVYQHTCIEQERYAVRRLEIGL